MFNLKIKFKNKIVLLIMSFISVILLLFLIMNISFLHKTLKQEVVLRNKLAIKALHTLETQNMKKYNDFLTNTAFYATEILMNSVNDIFSSLRTISRQYSEYPKAPDKWLTPEARSFTEALYVPLLNNGSSSKNKKRQIYAYWGPNNSGNNLLKAAPDSFLLTVGSCRTMQYSFGSLIKHFIVITQNLLIVCPPMKNQSNSNLNNFMHKIDSIPRGPSFQWTEKYNLLLCYGQIHPKNSISKLSFFVEIDYDTLTSFLYDYLSKFQLNNVVVIDKNGKIIAAKNKKEHVSLKNLLKRGNNIYEKLFRGATKSFLKNKKSGNFSFSNNSKEYQASFYTEKRFGWKLILISDIKNIMSSLKGTKKQLNRDNLDYIAMSKYLILKNLKLTILFFTVIFILVCIFSFFISKKIIRPLAVLRKAVKKISERDLKHKIPVIKTGDEIEDVTKAFNKMVDDLNTHIKNLTETVKAKEKVDAEINFAANVQKEMLPTNLEYTSKNQRNKVSISSLLEPAITIAGDFYDYFFIDNKHLFFVIGDVSGKGAPASLFMTVIKTYLEGCINHTNWSLKRIFEEINRYASKNNYSCMFATMFAGILNINSGRVKYASAAHEFPLIYRSSNNILEEIVLPKSTFLGAMADNVNFVDGEFILNPNDLLFLYTDGLTDAKNKNGDFFKKDRLKSIMSKSAKQSPNEVINSVKEEVAKFVKNTKKNDDITILTLKYK